MTEQPILFEKFPYTQERFFQTYKTLSCEEEHHVLLESGRTGRYSIAGIKPFAILEGQGGKIEIKQEGKHEVLSGNSLTIMENWMREFYFSPVEELPEFQGGAIGYISYDYGRNIEDIPSIAVDDLQFPDLYFLVFDEWAIFDHKEENIWLMVLNRAGAEEKLYAAKEKWLASSLENKESHLPSRNFNNQVQMSFTKETFIEAVYKIQHYISKGDVNQVNLTLRQSKALSTTPIEIYEELRIINPSPYMGYLHTPAFQIVSGSPELLIKKSGQTVSTKPIGGTRPRGVNAIEDSHLENELLSNEKENTEHLMLVEIEKDDFEKVCERGSVHADQLMMIEKYSHVMHLVSRVKGHLAQDKSTSNLIEAIFPGGSITGAPKVRTMEIIEELEPVRRGVYTGSLGWIGFNENLHLNVIIRTMLIKDNICHVQAGAGIVIDSNPESEYEESLNKAKALWQAMESATNK